MSIISFNITKITTNTSILGQGKFQTVLLVVSGCIYATCAISTTTLSFVLPSAECDFKMSSADKGKLSAMPLIGEYLLLESRYFWILFVVRG